MQSGNLIQEGDYDRCKLGWSGIEGREEGAHGHVVRTLRAVLMQRQEIGDMFGLWAIAIVRHRGRSPCVPGGATGVGSLACA